LKNSDLRLKREIGLPQATALVVGSIIGASIFVQPSEISGLVPSAIGIITVWFAAGLLSLIGALVCAELASIFTQTGGVYVYLKEAFSPMIGFLWGWALFWIIHTGIIAAIAVICGRYLAYFVPVGDVGVRALAVTVILLLSVVNYIGVKQGSTLQTLFTLGKVIAIVVMVLVGFVFGSGTSAGGGSTSVGSSPVGVTQLFSALIAGLFAFGGWNMVTYAAEETKDPRRTIPRALLVGMVVVCVSYIALNAVYLYVLPLETVASSTRIAADAADAVLGSGGGSFMSMLVVFSTFGALSGIILAGPRVYFAMARDGLTFGWLGNMHPKYRTPHLSIALQALWATVLVLTGTYRELFTRVIYTEWLFFALMTVGLFVLRQRPEIVRNYGVWGYPVTPALFGLAGIAIGVARIVNDPVDSLVGLGLVLLGMPVYAWWQMRTKRGQLTKA
jgi:APA family basic amino acid/polyamine antiporter